MLWQVINRSFPFYGRSRHPLWLIFSLLFSSTFAFFLYLQKERKCWLFSHLPFSFSIFKFVKRWPTMATDPSKWKSKTQQRRLYISRKMATLVLFMSGSSCFLSWRPENLLSPKAWFKYVCHLWLMLVFSWKFKTFRNWSLVTFSCGCMNIFSIKHFTFLLIAFFPWVSWWFFSNIRANYNELLRPFEMFGHKLYVRTLQLDMAD